MDMHAPRTSVSPSGAAGGSPARRKRGAASADRLDPLLSLLEGARAVEQLAGEALRQRHSKLGATHACVLLRLHQFGSASRTELQARLSLPGSSVGDAMRGLEAADLIRRSPGADRRRSVARLTDAGDRAVELVRVHLQRVAASIERDRRRPSEGDQLPYASGDVLRRAARDAADDLRA